MPEFILVDASSIMDPPKKPKKGYTKPVLNGSGVRGRRPVEGPDYEGMTKVKSISVKKLLRMVSTVEETAKLMGISGPTVRRMCIDGRLQARRAGGTWVVMLPPQYRAKVQEPADG